MRPNQSPVPDPSLRERAQHAYRRHPLIGKLAIATVMYGVANSGGAVDMAMDPFQDAGSVVEATLLEGEIPIEQEEFDGIPFAEYSPESQQRKREDRDAWHATVDRVAQTMLDLDAGDKDAIISRAETFSQLNAANIMEPAQVQGYLDRMEQAEDNDAVIAAFDEFMGFFGKTASLMTESSSNIDSLDPNTDVDKTRILLSNYVGALAYLPKPFVENFPFTNIQVGNKASMTAGHYDGSRDVTVATYSNLNRQVENFGLVVFPNWIYDGEETDAHVIIHEMQHAKNNGGWSDNATQNIPLGYVEHSVRELIGRPELASHYSTKSPKEANSDLVANVFDSSVGPEHPNEARRFGSAENADMILQLAIFEQDSPGFTDYVIAHNKRLMGDQALQ